MKQSTAKLVTFGRGGDTVHLAGTKTKYGSSSSKISGYGTPDNPHAARPRDDVEYPDGTPVIDTRPAIETEAGFSWVFRGPIVDVDLPDGEIDRIPDVNSSMCDALLAAGHDSIGFARAHAASGSKAPGPLDSVPVSEYVRGWLAHGARVGEYRNGAIIWKN